MIVTFCGHGQVSNCEYVRKWLKDVIIGLLEEGATLFYSGGYGQFDSMVAGVLKELKPTNPQLESVLVRAYLDRNLDTSMYDDTTFPPLEDVPRRYAINKTVTPSAFPGAAPFVAYYNYYQFETNKIDTQHPDLTTSQKRQKYANYRTESELKTMNALANSMLWLDIANNIDGRLMEIIGDNPGNIAQGQFSIVLTEAKSVYKQLGSSMSDDFERVLLDIIRKSYYGEYGVFKYALYSYGTYYQPLLVTLPNPAGDYAYIGVKKVDSVTGNLLSGAKFEVYLSNNSSTPCLGTFTTGSNGIGTFMVQKTTTMTGNTFTYYIKEKTAPDGYKLNSSMIPVTVDFTKNTSASTAKWATSGKTTGVFENTLPFSPYAWVSLDKVVKIGNAEPVPYAGVDFKVYDSSDKLLGTMTTNEAGHASLKLNFVGLSDSATSANIKVVETVADGNTSDSSVIFNDMVLFAVHKSEAEALKLNAGNPIVNIKTEPLKAWLSLDKILSVDGKESPYANIQFDIYDMSDKLIGSMTTDANGHAVKEVTFDGLAEGTESIQVKVVETARSLWLRFALNPR